MDTFQQSFIDKLNSVKAKRPKTVIDHILKYGFITSQELKDLYGYNHPPRAIRDVREHGIPIVTYTVTGADGRKIAAYKFGDPKDISDNISKNLGRTVLSKAIKSALIEKYGSKCFIYLENVDEKDLQIDHRIPYEISGEIDESYIDNFMLLSPSANRAKSWTCEHCANWEKKDIGFCIKCFWSHPEKYDHIAGHKIKVINQYFSGNEIEDYNKLISLAGEDNAQKLIKDIIHNFFQIRNGIRERIGFYVDLNSYSTPPSKIFYS